MISVGIWSGAADAHRLGLDMLSLQRPPVVGLKFESLLRRMALGED